MQAEDQCRARRFVGTCYALIFRDDQPFVALEDSAGERIAELFVLSGVNTATGQDDTTRVGPWEATAVAGESVFTLSCQSSIWDRKVYRFYCRPERFSYDISVEGRGALADVQYFGGYSSAHGRFGSGFFASSHAFRRGFNPEPSSERAPYVDAAGGATIDMVGGPGRRHWFLTPPPFCFAFETRSGWLGMGVEAHPGQWQFTDYRYQTVPGFYLSIPYQGYTTVDGAYQLPRIGFDFGSNPYEVLAAHVDALPAQPRNDKPRAAWWARPIFCGWGEQCYRAAADYGQRDGNGALSIAAYFDSMAHASRYSRQDQYEEFLAQLAAHDIVPGTIVLDDKWQSSYGENEADREKWPDLRGFVTRRHAAGQKVLLWIKAWASDGLQEKECIRNADGVPMSADPTNPAYAERLQRSVRRMLSPDGYDADGFKIDFTHRIPSGPGMQRHGREWGLELMRCYLAIIYDEAKRTKPDALIMTQTPHPYLAGVTDMIRLNDMQDLGAIEDPPGLSIEEILEHRSRVARIALPHALIDTDNWPVRNRDTWRRYLRRQASIGVPSLYVSSHIDVTQEPLLDEDYDLIRTSWRCNQPS